MQVHFETLFLSTDTKIETVSHDDGALPYTGALV